MKEIFINVEDSIKKIYLIEDEIIIEKHEEDMNSPMLEGNIYAGKIQNVLPGMQAAFVNIGSGKNAFIHLRDILPKQDLNLGKKNIQSNVSINELVKPGDSILVQVTRDETYKKGARVSKHISLTGRFFVYMPNTPFIAVSQKITEENKTALKDLISQMIPEETGGIVRTNAENAKKEDIEKDVKELINLWEEMKNLSINNLPRQLYDAGGIIRKYLIDNLDKGLEKIIVCNSKIKEQIVEFLKSEDKDIKIEINKDYLNTSNFQNQLKKIENRKIWLNCGGFITIDRTEALTAIDVNSGKFTGKDNFEDTVFKVNEEATIEIAKQLRMRDIGGIIIIDYIDMHIEENKQKILELIEKELKKDSSKVQIEGFTKLNLLELTRKHIYSV